jgi:hypothetical protein
LVPLDRSDIATPDGTGLFKKKIRVHVKILIIWVLAEDSFPLERISALGATAALFIAPVWELQRKMA